MSRNADNARRFKASLEKFDVYGLAGRFVAEIAEYALVKIVERTPVATGHAKGNWQVAIFGSRVAEIDRDDAAGNVTIADGIRKLRNMRGLQPVSISNAVPYIRALEEGHSQQAPAGMVGITVAEIRALRGNTRGRSRR